MGRKCLLVAAYCLPPSGGTGSLTIVFLFQVFLYSFVLILGGCAWTTASSGAGLHCAEECARGFPLE